MNGYFVSVENGEIIEIVDGKLNIPRDEDSGLVQGNDLCKVLFWSENGACRVMPENNEEIIRLNGIRISHAKPLDIFEGDRLEIKGIEYLFRTGQKKGEIHEHEYQMPFITELGGRRKLSATYKFSKSMAYQIKIFEKCEPENFTHMDFLFSGSELEVFYDIEGMVALSRLAELQVFNIFRVLNNIVEAVIKSGDFYIEHNCIAMSSEMIYVDPTNLTVRLVFVPDGKGSQNIYQDLGGVIEKISHMDGYGFLYSCRDGMLEHLRKRAHGMKAFTNLLLQEERAYISRNNMIQRDVGILAEEAADQNKASENGILIKCLRQIFSITANIKGYGVWFFLSQLLSMAIVFGIMTSGRTGMTDKIGFSLLVCAVDLWLLKNFQRTS